MKVALAGVERQGSAIDLRGTSIGGDVVQSAIVDPVDSRIVCPSPGPLHDLLGVVHREMAVRVRTLVAVAARTTRVETPYDHALAAAERTMAAHSVPAVSLEEVRTMMGDAGAEEARLRERVARLQGQVAAMRDADVEGVEAVAEELDAAIAALTDLETERVAAEQRLAQARRNVRRARDARDRRRSLADRVDNRRREARNWLVEQTYPEFRAAVTAVPGAADPGMGPSEYTGPDWGAALAACRIAELEAPLVVGDIGFDSAADAHDVLGAPVILVSV